MSRERASFSTRRVIFFEILSEITMACLLFYK